MRHSTTRVRTITSRPTLLIPYYSLSSAGFTLLEMLIVLFLLAGAVMIVIPRVVIGENRTFLGNEALLRDRGVEVVVLDDPECHRLMQEFIARFPEIWNEDIGQE